MFVTIGAVRERERERERATLLENGIEVLLSKQKNRKEKSKIKDMMYLCNFERKII